VNADLHIKLVLDIQSDAFKVETDIKKERLKDVMGDVLRSQLGAGADNLPAAIRDVYTINIAIDLSCDAIAITSDCGNKGLETGIISEAFRRMDENGDIR
jgi:hypothetical protein